jgi:NADP-dependent 3-hydroxy acid dehydrogenase YdfG
LPSHRPVIDYLNCLKSSHLLISPPQVALVTGAGGTIGEAITTLLVAEGYRVLAVDVSKDALNRLVERTSRDQVIPVPLDVRMLGSPDLGLHHGILIIQGLCRPHLQIGDAPSVEAACKDILSRWGVVTVLVNNGEGYGVLVSSDRRG